MPRSFVTSILFILHCLIFVQEFFLPLCHHRIFNYLINCTSHFLSFFWIEPLVIVKNYAEAFSSGLKVLKQVQHHVTCAFCTPLLLRDQRLLFWQAMINGIAFIIPHLHEVDFKSLKKRATSCYMCDNSDEFKCTNQLGLLQKRLQCLDNPTDCLVHAYGIG